MRYVCLDGQAFIIMIIGLTARKVETMTTAVGIQSLFPSLEAKAARLNAASNEANTLLASVDARLAQLNLGVEVWFSRPIESAEAQGDFDPSKTSSQVHQVLGFAKVDGKWGLAVKPERVVSGFFQGDLDCRFEQRYSDGPMVPLLKASRALRLTALTVMPDFLIELDLRVEHIVQSLEEAAIALDPEWSQGQ